jgi:chromosome segregation ATPase
MAAYVEIVFDNSDGRFSVDSDEVIIRRTIGYAISYTIYLFPFLF